MAGSPAAVARVFDFCIATSPFATHYLSVCLLAIDPHRELVAGSLPDFAETYGAIRGLIASHTPLSPDPASADYPKCPNSSPTDGEMAFLRLVDRAIADALKLMRQAPPDKDPAFVPIIQRYGIKPVPLAPRPFPWIAVGVVAGIAIFVAVATASHGFPPRLMAPRSV
jgi:hypothetical protein